MSGDSLLLEPEEIAALTGAKRAATQIEELHRQGFVRARRNRLGDVVLERAHYLAVCAGTYGGRTPEVEPVLNLEWPQPKKPRPRKA